MTTEKTNPIAPDLGATPDETQKAAWRASARDGIATVMVNRDKVLIRTTAMAAIDYQLNGAAASDGYYDAQLDSLGLKNAGEKTMMRAATVATQLDRGDKVDGKEAGKLLDAIASAMEGLVIAAGPTFTWAYDAACVSELVIVTSEAGGFRKLGDLARNENIDDKPRGVIRMDGAKVSALIATQVAERLGTASTYSLAVDNGDELTAIAGIELTLDDVTRALSNRDIVDGRPKALFEMTRATVAIAREKTAFTVKKDDDPKDAKTPKRQTEPHIVIAPSGEVTVSAHLAAGASNVVVIRGLDGIFDEPLDQTVMLPPQVHNKLALNLAKASQRNAVVIEDGEPDAATKLAVRTWRLRSEAAINSRYQLEAPV